MNNQDRQDVIEWLRGSKSFTYQRGLQLEKLARHIALEALTANPVGYRVMRCDGGVAAHCNTVDEAIATNRRWGNRWSIHPVFDLAAPTEPVRLPDLATADDVRWMLKQADHDNGINCRIEHAEYIGALMWNACRAEAKRLNEGSVSDE